MVNEELYSYCIENSTKESSVLKEVRRQTYLRTLRPQMLSGPLQGQLLKMLVSLFGVQSVLEIGTFTGYATICLAEGLPKNGKIHTVEMNQEFSWFHDQFFPKSGFADKIVCHYGDANAVIPRLEETFDLVFMDAGKKDYKSQLEMLLGKMNKGGIILADNVLWKERVLVPPTEQDKMTKYLHYFNKYVHQHPELENIILPIRDGINLIKIR